MRSRSTSTGRRRPKIRGSSWSRRSESHAAGRGGCACASQLDRLYRKHEHDRLLHVCGRVHTAWVCAPTWPGVRLRFLALAAAERANASLRFLTLKVLNARYRLYHDIRWDLRNDLAARSVAGTLPRQLTPTSRLATGALRSISTRTQVQVKNPIAQP